MATSARALTLAGALALALLAPLACGHSPTPDAAATASTAATTPPQSAFHLSEEQRARIHTAPVAMVTYRPTVLATGTVAFNGDRSTPVISQISGPVTRLLVNPGTYVQEGTALANVASPDFAEAVASYQKAQAALHNAARIATLDEQLFAADAIAKNDVEQARSDSASAVADREASIAQMVALGVDTTLITAIRDGKPIPPALGVIRAPIAGVLVERLINPGEVLTGGQTQCFTIADLSTVWVMANVFESEIGLVTRGETAWATTEASPDTFPGHVDYVAAIVDTATRATAVRIVVQNHRETLKRDMYVRVGIAADRPRTGLLVPVGSVLRDEQNLPFVYVAGKDGGFDRRAITLGARVGDRYEVPTGLTVGDQVVSEGGLFLQFAASQ
jgi:cobalt-zinc-cadmium efflux system membrane fusion protein